MWPDPLRQDFGGAGAAEFCFVWVEGLDDAVECAEHPGYVEKGIDAHGGLALFQSSQGAARDPRALGNLFRCQPLQFAPCGKVFADSLRGEADAGRGWSRHPDHHLVKGR